MEKNESNFLGAFSYILVAGSAILLLLLKGDDDFIRFHSVQSIAFSIVAFIFLVIVSLTELLISFQQLIPLLVIPNFIYLIIFFAFLALWINLIYRAFNGNKYSFPLFKSLMNKINNYLEILKINRNTR